MCDQLQPFLAINETFRSELASMLKLVQHDKQAQENGIAPTTTTTAIDEELYYLNWLALVVGELDDIHNLNALYIITTFVKQSYPEVAKYYESPTPETLTRLLQRFQSKSLPDINEHIKWLYSPAYLSERLLRNTGDNHNRLHRIDSDLIYVDFFPRTLSYFSDSRIEHVCKKYDQMRLYRPALDAGHE
jgi:hypothetical protein